MNIENSNLNKVNSPILTLRWYFSILVKRNARKYAFYVFSMKWFVRILTLFHGKVSKAMNYQYAGLRIIDDRLDGDLPILDKDIVAYAENRFRILESLTSDIFVPENPEDSLLQEALRIARESNQEGYIQISIQKIIGSMIFDAKRIKKYKSEGKLEFSSHDDLIRHFYDLDIIGTGGGMLVYLGSKQIDKDIEKLYNIGRACRIEYNLHDFIEDISQGIVNISIEDAQKYNITISDLEYIRSLPIVSPIDPKDPAKIWYQDLNKFPSSVIAWMKEQISNYDQYMKVFISEEYPTFPPITRFVFRKFYINDIKYGIERFRRILNDLH